MSISVRVLRAWALSALLAVVLVVQLSGGARAEEKSSASPGSSIAAVDQNLEADAAAVEADFSSLARQMRQQLRAAVGSSKAFPSDLAGALARDQGVNGRGWLLEAIVSGIVAVAIGVVLAAVFERMTVARLPAVAADLPFGRQAAERRVLEVLLYVVGALIVLAAGFVVIEVLDSGIETAYQTALVLLSSFAMARCAVLCLGAVLTPKNQRIALQGLTPAEAVRLRRAFVTFVVLFTIFQTLDRWLALLDMSPSSLDLAALVMSLVLAVLLCVTVVRERKSLPKALGLYPATDTLGTLISAGWWVVAVVYFVAAWIARAISTLVDAEGSASLVVAPVILFAVGLVVYGALHAAIGRSCRPRVTIRIGGPSGRRIPDYCDLAYEGAALGVFLAALVILSVMWGADVATGGLGATLIKVAAIAIVGYLAYQWVRIAIDRKHAREGGIANIHSDDESFKPLAPGQSRLATLLPLARVFVLGTILVIVVLMVLSELGVNVVPLFAGASIFGLAIGFGSQTLVHDIMSGAFFLVDDAFRVGEYVDLGGGSKGTVEKISVRSFQLRHQNGPLHTIPFGGIKQVTNLSRDWAITKLPFSFPHGTDVEKVRKVIKKVGETIAADEVLGPMFLEPVKSQGVTVMDSNSMTFSVKFMTRPVDASAAKRAVYARLSQAFIAAGLDFASSTVVVKLANEPDRPLTPSEREALAGAAASMAQES